MPLKLLGKTKVIFKGEVKVKNNEVVLPPQSVPVGGRQSEFVEAVEGRPSEFVEGWKRIMNERYG